MEAQSLQSFPLPEIRAWERANSIFDFAQPLPKDLIDKFWSKVEKTDSCWIWKGFTVAGYGAFNLTNECMAKSHRISYELLKGPIPKNLTLDHLCSNKRCVNPDHLEPVTIGVNVLRADSVSGRNLRKSHCNNGHLLAGANLLPGGLRRGHRDCRACYNQRKARSLLLRERDLLERYGARKFGMRERLAAAIRLRIAELSYEGHSYPQIVEEIASAHKIILTEDAVGHWVRKSRGRVF